MNGHIYEFMKLFKLVFIIILILLVVQASCNHIIRWILIIVYRLLEPLFLYNTLREPGFFSTPSTIIVTYTRTHHWILLELHIQLWYRIFICYTFFVLLLRTFILYIFRKRYPRDQQTKNICALSTDCLQSGLWKIFSYVHPCYFLPYFSK